MLLHVGSVAIKETPSNGKSWETAKTSQENLAYHTYGSFLAFMPDTGNDREAVNAAFQKLWDLAGHGACTRILWPCADLFFPATLLSYKEKGG